MAAGHKAVDPSLDRSRGLPNVGTTANDPLRPSEHPAIRSAPYTGGVTRLGPPGRRRAGAWGALPGLLPNETDGPTALPSWLHGHRWVAEVRSAHIVVCQGLDPVDRLVSELRLPVHTGSSPPRRVLFATRNPKDLSDESVGQMALSG